MSEESGEKTEQPTAKKLEEAIKHGQIARSPEVQTVFVILAGMTAIRSYGMEMWDHFTFVFTAVLGHLHEIDLGFDALPDLALKSSLMIVTCVAPVVAATAGAGLLAGVLQNRFQTASEALTPNWARLNPVSGFGRIFSAKAAVPALISLLKLGVIGMFSWSQVRAVLDDPIFHTAVDTKRVATFLADTAHGIAVRVLMTMAVIAACDYAYQLWKTKKDLMMTKQEVKDESKQSESNPHVKGEMRKRRLKMKSFRAQLADVPKADVIVTNPTHIAIALHYDRETMKAPKIVAKARGFNAGRIRELAREHQIPILENKPLARMMYKYGRVDGEVPVQLYAAVAEILAYVYRVNRYRYHVQARPAKAAA
jgi:flagellar biosynthetic protein FlhB